MEVIITKGDKSVMVKDEIIYSREVEQMARRLFDDLSLGLPLWGMAEEIKAEKHAKENTK